MKLLLDTHIWIWSIESSQRLSRSVRRELQKSSNELYLSPISIWEAHHIARRGKLRLKQTFSQWLDGALAQTPLREAPFIWAAGSASASINLPHSDLGDIFLAATALAFDLTLVTSDSQLLGCAWLKTMSND